MHLARPKAASGGAAPRKVEAALLIPASHHPSKAE
jgi:hypothetical protein